MQETPSDLDVVPYRTWSVPALLTAGVGAVSWLPLFSGTMIFVPMLALILGLVTWWQLAARPDHWLGARFAWFGVAVAILSLGLFAGREWSQRAWLYEGARQTSEQWLRYQKDGEPLMAYDLHRRPQQRLLFKEALTSLVKGSKEEREKYEKYTRQRIIDLLQRTGPTLEWKLEKITPDLELEHQRYVRVLYKVQYQENNRKETIPVEFLIERALFPVDKEFRWMIYGISSPLVQGDVPEESGHSHQ